MTFHHRTIEEGEMNTVVVFLGSEVFCLTVDKKTVIVQRKIGRRAEFQDVTFSDEDIAQHAFEIVIAAMAKHYAAVELFADGSGVGVEE